jgi:AcrR family transcriptional regulator
MSDCRTQKKAEKREHILACAQRVFASRGVVEATMDDIAHESGVSKGALYLLFSNKDELYLQLATAAAKGLVERMRQAAGRGTGFEQARALLRTYAHFYLEDATRFRLALAWLAPGFHLDDAIPSANTYREIIVEVMRTAVEAFEAGQRDGSIRTDLDARRTVLECWGAVVGLLLLRAKASDEGPLPPQVNGAMWRALGKQEASPGSIELEHLVDEFIDLVLSAVQSPHRAAAVTPPAAERRG